MERQFKVATEKPSKHFKESERLDVYVFPLKNSSCCTLQGA